MASPAMRSGGPLWGDGVIKRFIIQHNLVLLVFYRLRHSISVLERVLTEFLRSQTRDLIGLG